MKTTAIAGEHEINNYATLLEAKRSHPIGKRVELVFGEVAIASRYELRPANAEMAMRGWTTMATVWGQVL